MSSAVRMRERTRERELVCDICGVLRWVKLLVFFSCSFVLSSFCFSKLFNALGCALCLALSHISFLFLFFPPLGFFVTLFLNFIWFQEHFTGCAPSFHQLKLNRETVWQLATMKNKPRQTKTDLLCTNTDTIQIFAYTPTSRSTLIETQQLRFKLPT